MAEKKTKKIDFSSERFGNMADKFYNKGDYISALRFAYRQYVEFGGDAEIFARIADIYEGMNLPSVALKWWYRFLNVADEVDLPEAYEGLAVNYLNMGYETQAAYYYKKLMEVDSTLPPEAKMQIAETFSKKKGSHLRVTYPPEKADYSLEMEGGSKALKAGDCARAIEILSRVEKGAKDYPQAQEMQAVAYLLSGEAKRAETICQELLLDEPRDVRTLATLSAAYLEQNKTEESLAIAKRLANEEQTEEEELYKVATVCCENGLHEEALKKFQQLEKIMPYEGKMLFFKGMSALKCGKTDVAEDALDRLCTIHPEAEVAKYFLFVIRYAKETGEWLCKPEEFTYFYHLPNAEREARCDSLVTIINKEKDEASLLGLVALHDGYFEWCFDEMDGNDHDLQYLGLTAAEKARADEFLQEKTLDFEVLDVFKIEILRMLYMRNKDADIGVVLGHIYRYVPIHRIQIGRKKRKIFLQGYAKTASRFAIVKDGYALKMKRAAEKLYRAVEKTDALDLFEKEGDIACAIYMLSELHELGQNEKFIYDAFEADKERVQRLVKITSAVEEANFIAQSQNEKENKNEID